MIAGWEVSAEYPGAACRALDARLGTECAMFLQGTGGDAKRGGEIRRAALLQAGL